LGILSFRLPDGGESKTRIEAILLPRFAAVDALATHYGHNYRTPMSWRMGLSTVAVRHPPLRILDPHHDGEVPL